MWSDSETDKDFLNFTGIAGTVAEIIVQAQGQPISIGVSGAWGAGKSSMIKLIRSSLSERVKEKQADFVFVEFNAWLYQGYDDARAALMEVIATALEKEAEKRKTGVDKTKEFIKRINWLRAAKLTAGSAIALALGLPPVGVIGELFKQGKRVFGGDVDEKLIGEMETTTGQIGPAASGLVKDKPDSTPPKEIHALRECFEAALEELGIKLIVLIDDLDRCLPATTISTLEAIRLFLFLRNTAFVIAADNEMIKHAVRRHFEGVDDQVVTSYFDKLIQVPIRVPTLGTQEVRAYLLLLFVENSGLDKGQVEQIREKVCVQLSQTWQGKRVDRAFIQSLQIELPQDLIARLDAADRLAPLMANASGINGNPRLIKRFLNALSIRMAISRAQGVGVDEAVLVKMLLFERCGDPKAYTQLIKAVTESESGKPRFLAEWEEKAIKGAELKLEAPWDDQFFREWLTLPPRLADVDLRGVLYVSREHAPLIMPEDRLSSEGAVLLSAVLEHPDMAGNLKDRLKQVPRPELSFIMDRLLDRARQEQEWGVPPILEACLVVAETDLSQGARLGAFLAERPPGQIKPNIVPKIADLPWAKGIFERWNGMSISGPVKAAIKHHI